MRVANRERINVIKDEYHKRGFLEVITPNIASKELWGAHGMWQFMYDSDGIKLENG